MKKLAKNVLGLFVLEDEELVEFFSFSKDPLEVTKKLKQTTDKEKELKEKYGEMEEAQIDAFDIGKKAGLVESREQVYSLMKKVSKEYTRSRIKEEQDHDQVMIQAVRRLSELDKQINKSIERLKAWYGLYFPELEQKVSDNEEFLEKISNEFYREKIMEKMDIKDTTGFEMDDMDIEHLKNFVDSTLKIVGEKKDLESYVESLAERLVPNTSAVVGPLLAAKTLSEAGSLKKLARMPSSTIQVLGAEKALFRHMEGKGSAPKHGILFLHHTVSGLPEDKRGKMARYLSNKLALAARLDMYEGEFKGEEYREEVEEKYRKLKEGEK